jgi:hypothetical protein
MRSSAAQIIDLNKARDALLKQVADLEAQSSGKKTPLQWEGAGRGGPGNRHGRKATVSARPAWEIRDKVSTKSQTTSSAAQATASTIDAVHVLKHVPNTTGQFPPQPALRRWQESPFCPLQPFYAALLYSQVSPPLAQRLETPQPSLRTRSLLRLHFPPTAPCAAELQPLYWKLLDPMPPPTPPAPAALVSELACT